MDKIGLKLREMTNSNLGLLPALPNISSPPPNNF